MMNRVLTHSAVAAVAIALLHGWSGQAPAAPLVDIATVEIGDAGNSADTTGLGSVSVDYYMSTYEVTIAQYASFLNAVATESDTFDLYNTSMASNAAIAGISRTGSGSVGDPFSYGTIGDANRPITYVSWNDAARFANWVNNGATLGGDTESGAYDMSSSTPTREAEATWWIPGVDEWYKAAYYDEANSVYSSYPTASDAAPTAGNVSTSQTSGTKYANFDNGFNTAPDTISPAGTFSESASFYGTFDQGGNVEEWTENTSGSDRTNRGGSWFDSDADALESTFPTGTASPLDESQTLGFRLASSTGIVPEPSAALLLLLAACATLFLMRRRRSAAPSRSH